MYSWGTTDNSKSRFTDASDIKTKSDWFPEKERERKISVINYEYKGCPNNKSWNKKEKWVANLSFILQLYVY